MQEQPFVKASELEVGLVVDIRDQVGKWLGAEVIKRVGHVVTVHFINWGSKWDEEIDYDQETHRFRQFATLSPATSENPAKYEVGDKAYVLPVTPMPRAWVVGTVERVDGPQVKVRFNTSKASDVQYWFHVDSQELSLENPEAPPPSPIPKGWQCLLCTYENEKDVIVCEMCNNPKPTTGMEDMSDAELKLATEAAIKDREEADRKEAVLDTESIADSLTDALAKINQLAERERQMEPDIVIIDSQARREEEKMRFLTETVKSTVKKLFHKTQAAKEDQAAFTDELRNQLISTGYMGPISEDSVGHLTKRRALSEFLVQELEPFAEDEYDDLKDELSKALAIYIHKHPHQGAEDYSPRTSLSTPPPPADR